ncbi:pyridoxal-phosphate-dependent aminotransferase family protein [Staphylococcus auricularis]|uniref:pyridoxal-phosphate-dependent aminotransferase family protein n=1 Tax=Staphylococcus auricularis TaxID=29379 RepID=UPI003EBF0699
MSLNHRYLLTPGPTPVPQPILQAMQQPMIGHRTAEFETLADEASRALMPVFGTEHPVLILTSSGTSVLEAAMLNTVEAEDHFVVVVSGAFGYRFKQIAETYYKNAHIYDVTWGEAVDVDDLLAFIDALSVSIKAVFCQYCEISTAVLHPIHQLGHALHQYDKNIYFIVDGVSSIGAVDANMSRDNIDVLVSGSQKALMLPPGLAFVAYNDRALQRFENVQTPSFYLYLNRYISSLNDHFTPFTPNISLFQGILAYASMIQDEGFEEVIKRHYLVRDCLRQALIALDLELLVVEEDASPTVTAFIPKNAEELATIKYELDSRFNIVIAGGQGQLKGKILRLGHLGQVTPFDILQAVAALEIILSDHRKTNYIGKGTIAFMEVLSQHV